MRTRGLMECIEEMPPQLEDVKLWYPNGVHRGDASTVRRCQIVVSHYG